MDNIVNDAKDKLAAAGFSNNLEPTRRGPARKTKLGQLFHYAQKLKEDSLTPFVSPAEMLMFILHTGRDPLAHLRLAEMGDAFKKLGKKPPALTETVIITDKDTGVTVEINGMVPLETRIECARSLLPFYHSRQGSLEVTGEDGAPLFETNGPQARAYASDPEIRALMEKIQEKAVVDPEA